MSDTRTDPAALRGSSRDWWARIEVDAPAGVLLRAMVPQDADGVLAVHGDPRVYTLDPHETHPNVEHSRTFIAPMLAHWKQHGFGYWAVLVPPDWWPAGVSGVVASDGDRVFAGLGGVQHHTVAGRPVLNVYFRFAPAVHRRGLASTVLSWSAQVAPHVASGVDLVVRTRPANTAARKATERAGYLDEGLEPGTTDMQFLRLTAPRPD